MRRFNRIAIAFIVILKACCAADAPKTTVPTTRATLGTFGGSWTCEIEQFASMCIGGERPPLYELFMLDGETGTRNLTVTLVDGSTQTVVVTINVWHMSQILDFGGVVAEWELE